MSNSPCRNLSIMPSRLLDTQTLQGTHQLTLEEARARVVRGFEVPVREYLTDAGLWSELPILSVVTSVKADGAVEGSLLTGFNLLPIVDMPVRKLWPEVPAEMRAWHIKFNLRLEDFTFQGNQPDAGVSGNMFSL